MTIRQPSNADIALSPESADGELDASVVLGSAMVVVGDGTRGLAEFGPFDAIVVTAAGDTIPPPLLDQLAGGGRLIMPVGAVHGPQNLVRLRRDGDRFVRDDLGPVRFVPLVADQ